MDARLLGRWGEVQAADFLRRKKYKIVSMNYRCRFGEVDIIAENRGNLVFVEVKLRKDAEFARAAEFVTRQKQERVRAAAQLWLSQHETDKQPRFDVVEVYAPQGAQKENIQILHMENAF